MFMVFVEVVKDEHINRASGKYWEDTPEECVAWPAPGSEDRLGQVILVFRPRPTSSRCLRHRRLGYARTNIVAMFGDNEMEAGVV